MVQRTHPTSVLVLFATCLAVLFSACSSGKKTLPEDEGSNRVEQKTPPPKPIIGEGSSDPCKIFEAVMDYALEVHLSRKPSEKKAIANKAFQLMANYSRAASEVLKQYYLENPNEDYSTCKPYMAVSGILKKAASIKTELSNEDFEKLDLYVLRLGIYSFCKALDGVSFYQSPKADEASSTQEDTIGVGIKFLQRTDYDFGRKPPYLVIKDVWRSSKNKGKRDKLIEMRVLGVEVPSIPSGKESDHIEQNSMFFAKPSAYSSVSELIETLNDRKKLDQTHLNLLIQNPDGSPAFVEKLEIGVYKASQVFVDWIPLNPDDPTTDDYAVLLEMNTFAETDTSTALKQEWITTLLSLIQKIKTTPMTNVRGILLDLRGNGGGSLDEAKQLLAMFLQDNTVYANLEEVYVKGEVDETSILSKRTQNGKQTYLQQFMIDHSCPGCFAGMQNIVVLMDRYSASASELTASVLFDYKKAWIVGDRPYGKGIGMSAVKLAAPIGGRLAINTFYNFSPTGKNYLMEPYFMNTMVTDHITQKAYETTYGAWSRYHGIEVSLRENQSDYSLAIPKPTLPVGIKWTEDEPAWISDDVAQQMSDLPPPSFEPNICDSSLSAPIHEEDDCLLQTGVYYLRNLIEFNSSRS